MKKNIFTTLLFSLLVNQLDGAALAQKLARNASRTPIHLKTHIAKNRSFHNYQDIKGAIASLPQDKQPFSPVYGAVAIASKNLHAWKTQEDKQRLFNAFFHERDGIIYPTVAPGNPISSLNPQLWGKFVTMTCNSSFNLETFLVSDFVKEWHTTHVKTTGRYEKIADFKQQIRRVINPLMQAEKDSQATAIAAATCLKFPTRQELQKVFKCYKNFDAVKFKVEERFNQETLHEAEFLMSRLNIFCENTKEQKTEKLAFLALESTRNGISELLQVPFQHANYKNKSIPPCTEVALRTFINTLLIDSKTGILSFDQLPTDIVVNPEFKAFIRKHQDPTVQNYYTNSKDKWMNFVSNKPHIGYLKGNTEMNGQMDNSLALLNYCFGTQAATLAEFGKNLSTENKEIIIDDKDEKHGTYNTQIKTVNQTFNGTWRFSEEHVSYKLEGADGIKLNLPSLIELSEIKKNGISFLEIIPQSKQKSIFEESDYSIFCDPSWSFDRLEKICKLFKLDLGTFLYEDESNFLHIVAKYDRPDLVKPLIHSGVGLEQKNHSGRTPLTAAVYYGNKRVTEALAQLGADLNVRDIHGETPLLIAIKLKNIPMIETLLNLGADINKKSNPNEGHGLVIQLIGRLITYLDKKSWGETPLERAKKVFGTDHQITKKIHELGGI